MCCCSGDCIDAYVGSFGGGESSSGGGDGGAARTAAPVGALAADDAQARGEGEGERGAVTRLRRAPRRRDASLSATDTGAPRRDAWRRSLSRRLGLGALASRPFGGPPPRGLGAGCWRWRWPASRLRSPAPRPGRSGDATRAAAPRAAEGGERGFS